MFKNRILWRGTKSAVLAVFYLASTAVSVSSEYDQTQGVFAFECLTFKGPDSSTLVEVFCQISTDGIQFIKFKDGFFGSYELSITVSDSSNNPVRSASLIDSVKVKTFWEIDRPRAARLIRFPLSVRPGVYQTQIRFKDLETLRETDFEKEIRVPDYRDPNLQLSDLQIAASLKLSDEPNALVKNGWKVIPNVRRLLGPQPKVMFLYAELYNLDYSADKAQGEFVATVTISNDEDAVVKSFTYQSEKPGKTAILTLAVPIAELEPGRYQVSLVVRDPDSGQSNHRFTYFYVVHSDQKVNL